MGHPGKPGSKVIDSKVLEKERKKGFQITRVDRFKNKTRHFSDSGIIGTVSKLRVRQAIYFSLRT